MKGDVNISGHVQNFEPPEKDKVKIYFKEQKKKLMELDI